MPPVHITPVVGFLAQVALLGALAATVGLNGSGWIVGVVCGVLTNALVRRGATAYGVTRLGPADLVTLTRVVLAGGVAALVADTTARPAAVSALVALSLVALGLDAVDGRVARRTGTASAFGARFDGEADAFLMLVLSMYVARSAGSWVLAIGAARYVFLAAGWVLPWMRRTLPPRYWRKVVAAVQGVALTLAASALLSPALTEVLLVAAAALLTESFGRDVVWLWHRRDHEPVTWVRSVSAGVLTTLALVLAWFSLVAPNVLIGVSPASFVRVPLEALILLALVLVLPRRAGRGVTALVGAVLGLLVVVKVLDTGFTAAVGRPFDAASDLGYLGSAIDLVGDSIGRPKAVAATVAAGLAVVAVLGLAPLAALRLARIADRHRSTTSRAVAGLGAVWVVCAVLGLQLIPGTPIASTSATGLALDEARQVYAGIQDRQQFASAAAQDTFAGTHGTDLLTRLRGKDVLVVFVESYGRVAVQGSTFSPKVDAVLDAGTRQLAAAGFATRSAFLTSPTYGGISWLAHSTLQSGLWIDSQPRYDALMTSNRLTLTAAFERAGWRTVADIPPDDRDWPQGTSFYGYDTIYDSRNVGYAGPKFSYAPVPDQYTLATFRRLELAAADRRPVMAEIDLVSSHAPWAPLPRMVAWNQLGDGSVYDAMPAQGQSPSVVWRDPAQVQAAYGQSIQYSLSAIISFVTTYPDPNLVLVVLGDHQPASIVSGPGPNRDVPITVISHDPVVMDRISSWGWQDGMRPGPDATVWPMDAFRDRFLAAFGP